MPWLVESVTKEFNRSKKFGWCYKAHARHFEFQLYGPVSWTAHKILLSQETVAHNCTDLFLERHTKFYFLKKLWRNVGGRMKRENLVLNSLIQVELPPWEIWKADASSVRTSSFALTKMVRFTNLSRCMVIRSFPTRLIKPNFLSHHRFAILYN